MRSEILPASQAQSFGLPDLQVMAKNVAASRLFPGVENEQAAFTLMLLCQAEGLHPIQALRRYHIIEGRPSMRADAMQAEFQRNGGLVRWGRSDAEVCEATFLHPVHAPDPGVSITLAMKELVDSGVATTWSKEDRQYVLKKNYRQFGAAMLRARVISQAVRMVMPGVVVGIYAPEEIERDDDVIDVTPRRETPEPPSRAVETGPAELPASRSAVNEAFKPAPRSAEPAPAREKIKLGGDKIGARGTDVRAWVKLVEDEVGSANKALLDHRVKLDLDAKEATNGFEMVRHMVKWATSQGADDPESPGPDGKPKRVGIGKLNAHLHDLYGSDGWRDPMRRELKRYLTQKLDEGRQVADNEAHGDAPEDASQEPTTAPEDDSQLAHAGNGHDADGSWPPGRE